MSSPQVPEGSPLGDTYLSRQETTRPAGLLFLPALEEQTNGKNATVTENLQPTRNSHTQLLPKQGIHELNFQLIRYEHN